MPTLLAPHFLNHCTQLDRPNNVAITLRSAFALVGSIQNSQTSCFDSAVASQERRSPEQ